MENLIDKVINLKDGEALYISEPKDTIKACAVNMEILNMERASYENLFNVALKERNEITNEFNMEKFMDLYNKNKLHFNTTRDVALMAIFGVDNYKILSALPDINIRLHLDTSQVIITKLAKGERICPMI